MVIVFENSLVASGNCDLLVALYNRLVQNGEINPNCVIGALESDCFNVIRHRMDHIVQPNSSICQGDCELCIRFESINETAVDFIGKLASANPQLSLKLLYSCEQLNYAGILECSSGVQQRHEESDLVYVFRGSVVYQNDFDYWRYRDSNQIVESDEVDQEAQLMNPFA